MARNFKLINESSIDKVSARLYQTLLERFGEPISHKQNTAVGIADEGPGGKSTWKDAPKKDREWSDPDVVNEIEDDLTCNQCGKMKTVEGDSACQCDMSDY